MQPVKLRRLHAMELLFGIVFGMLVWGPVIFCWVTYVRAGKPSKVFARIGSLIVFGLPTLGLISALTGDTDLPESYRPMTLEQAVGASSALKVATLLEAGAAPDSGASGNSLLVKATENGDGEIVRILLAHGAKVHPAGDRALVIARQRGREDIVGILKQGGATP
jgi:ankyrin repeat protein